MFPQKYDKNNYFDNPRRKRICKIFVPLQPGVAKWQHAIFLLSAIIK